MTLQTNLLQGELVYLGALTKTHKEQTLAWDNNIDHMRLLNPGMHRPRTLEQSQEEYEGNLKNDGMIQFAIFTIEDDKFIGFCEAVQMNWKARNCWIGINIGESEHQGKGYGTDAMRVLLRYIFMEMNLHRVALGVFAYNERAIKSYEKLGFKHEGSHREALWRDGKYYDEHFMAILRPEWEAMQS